MTSAIAAGRGAAIEILGDPVLDLQIARRSARLAFLALANWRCALCAASLSASLTLSPRHRATKTSVREHDRLAPWSGTPAHDTPADGDCGDEDPYKDRELFGRGAVGAEGDEVH